MDWYQGPTLLEHLETVPIDSAADEAKPFRMPVQWVNRPGQHFRGFAGQVASGRVAPGDEVRILPSGRMRSHGSTSDRDGLDGDLDEAVAGQSVTLTLTEEIDCSRGDVIAAAKDPPHAADQFEATIVWMADEPLIPGRGYWLKLGTQTATATVAAPQAPAERQHAGGAGGQDPGSECDRGRRNHDRPCHWCSKPIATMPGRAAPNRALGGFILIDKLTNATVAAGMLHFALRRAENVHWQALDVGRETHARLKGQKPAVLWFTGLSGAGKSTIANLVEKKLAAMGRHTFLLDGDNVRHGLNKDLGFTETDRIENIRRVGEVAKLMSRRRPDRADRLHLAVPRRARDGAANDGRGRVFRRSSSTPRWPRRRHATSRASMPRPAPASCPISPASTALTRRPKSPNCGSTRRR